jgi:plastocyanin
MTEFSFTLTENGAPVTSVRSGQVTFVVTNNGSILDNFDLKTVHMGPLIDHGKTQSFTVGIAPGSYKYQCDVPGHAQQGMMGTLVVTADA